jgi:hypothetical protein
MNNIPMILTGTTHQMFDALLGVFGRRRQGDDSVQRDRGAVSLEQVLWFVAAGVSVAVIAAILWNQIRDQAESDIDVPVAPTPSP